MGGAVQPGPPVNSDAPEFFPSVTRDGTLYFTRSGDGGTSAIFRAPAVDGGWGEPTRLPATVNSTPSQYNAFIAPDESYLLFATAGRPDSRGGSDYYVCFRERDGWTEPINLGDRVNTPAGAEFSAYVSPDGRYLFFMSARGPGLEALPDTLTADALHALQHRPGATGAAIYWIDASFIQALRPAAAPSTR